MFDLAISTCSDAVSALVRAEAARLLGPILTDHVLVEELGDLAGLVQREI
jgi:hypothetical protein